MAAGITLCTIKNGQTNSALTDIGDAFIAGIMGPAGVVTIGTALADGTFVPLILPNGTAATLTLVAGELFQVGGAAGLNSITGLVLKLAAPVAGDKIFTVYTRRYPV